MTEKDKGKVPKNLAGQEWCSKCARRKARRIYHHLAGRHPSEEELDAFAAKYKTLISNNDINDLMKIVHYFVI